MSAPDLLFVGHGAERSGPPIYLANLQGWLAAHTDLRFSTLLARGGPLVDQYADVRVVERPWAPVRLTSRSPLLQGPMDRRTLGEWHQAGAVYVNTLAPETLRLAELVDVPTIAHVHELEAALRYGVDASALRRLLDRADHLVAASQAVADNLVENHGVARDRIAVHHEFVTPVDPPADRAEARRRLGLPEHAFVVGGSGMLEWRKGPELFVRLAADVRRRTDRPIVFLWVGGTDQGPLWAPLDHEAHHLGVADVVRFVGAQDRPGDWFGVLDAFALTSREDAFPLAALEAGSAGVPVVTFDTGGMVELEGVVVVPYPDTEAFADALVDLGPGAGARVAEAVRTRHLTEVGAPRLWQDLRRWLGR